MRNENQPPVCLTIAGIDPSGGAGIIADVRTFSAFGCVAAAAVTSVTFQNSAEFLGAAHQPAFDVMRQMEVVLDDCEVAAVKTGMLPTRDVATTVAAVAIERGLFNKHFVVDPVLRSSSGGDLSDADAFEIMVKLLFPMATLVTPNIPEAEKIAGITIRSADDIHKAGILIRSLGARNVLIKGGHRFSNESAEAIDYLFTGDEVITFAAEFIETVSMRGTGCILASAITANLALGNSLIDSVGIAKDFVRQKLVAAAGRDDDYYDPTGPAN